jgi:predicted ATPase
MLTRLKVSGFKNLVDVDVRFGSFTCIAGANGVGKSNLFDAIGFLSALAELPLMEAAKSIRDGRTADVANLFHCVGGRRDETMSFMVEMIIPKSGADDLGQEAVATITFLRYSLELALRKAEGNVSSGGLELRKEELEHINITDASEHLLFPYSKEWRQSALQGRRTVPFISTREPVISTREPAIIQLHQDRGGSGGGRPAPFLASTLPRTVLSSVNAAETRTAVLARREMQSWRRLQLEPAALREPDTFATPPRLGSDGSHLAATLFHLAHGGAIPLVRPSEHAPGPDPSTIYARVANRLADLIDDVREVGVEVDPQRELWTLFASGKDGTKHPARALSDGTLRFLALAVMELDPVAQGVLCLEEPENGIHPERIPAMLRLLKEIAAVTDDPIGPDNPLRQVIINTHSPAVVSEVDDDSLLFAQLHENVRDGQRFQSVHFAALPDTWRTKGDKPAEEIRKGDILVYLSGPRPAHERDPETEKSPSPNGQSTSAKTLRKRRRVIDRDDVQRLLNFGDDSE